MVSEVARGLKIRDDDDASDELMALSPFEMRNLLHHIMSGREFGFKKAQSGYNIISDTNRVSKVWKLFKKLFKTYFLIGCWVSNKYKEQPKVLSNLQKLQKYVVITGILRVEYLMSLIR